jgi:hypothetical protein
VQVRLHIDRCVVTDGRLHFCAHAWPLPLSLLLQHDDFGPQRRGPPPSGSGKTPSRPASTDQPNAQGSDQTDLTSLCMPQGGQGGDQARRVARCPRRP